jgi:hypothetical protein
MNEYGVPLNHKYSQNEKKLKSTTWTVPVPVPVSNPIHNPNHNPYIQSNWSAP